MRVFLVVLLLASHHRTSYASQILVLCFTQASLPSSTNMTPGESFGASLFNVIFFLKFLIIGTIYAYEKYEKESDGETGGAWSQLEMGGRDDEIAE